MVSASMSPKPKDFPAPKVHPADWAVLSGSTAEIKSELELYLKKRKRLRKKLATLTATAALCAVCAAWLVPYVRQTSTVATPATTRQSLAFSDGTHTELNARTSLSTDFRYGRRTVTMASGEAFFSVAKDASHPFKVITPQGMVRVTGTQFNVRLASDGSAEVTLVEGNILVFRSTDREHPLSLAPGEDIVLSENAPQRETLTPAQMKAKLAWRQGMAFFDHESLANAAAQFAAFHGITIRVDPSVASLRLGGSYALADLDQFLDAMGRMLPVKATRAEDRILISPK